jgi:hypothetical protein
VISNITYSNLISFLDELSIPVQCVVFIQRIAYDPVLYYVMVQQFHCLAVVWTAHRAHFLVSERLHWGLHYYLGFELNLGRLEIELGSLR